MARVSVGQAAVTALQTWLRRSLPEDVAVYDRWPDADVRLFAPAQAGLPPSRAVVSVMKVGRRQRVDVIGPSPGPTITPDGAGKFLVTFRLGSYVQPVQLDLWTASDVDRDDVLDQLDTALTAGIDKTLGIVGGDPVRDGVLLPLAAPYSGNVEFLLDEPETSDDGETVQDAEFRASWSGEARGEFLQTARVSAISTAILAQQLSLLSTPPAGQLWSLASLTTTASPPPATKVTYSTSSTP